MTAPSKSSRPPQNSDLNLNMFAKYSATPPRPRRTFLIISWTAMALWLALLVWLASAA